MQEEIAIEVKASKNIAPQDLKNLRALQEEQQLKHYIIVCLESTPRIIDNIQILPWRIFLEKLWGDF